MPVERTEANLVFQLVRGRYERGTIMLTSNKTVAEWSEVVGDEVSDTALRERLLHHAEVFSIRGHSSRLHGKRLDGGPQGPAPEAPGASDHAQKGGEAVSSL